MTEVVPDSSIVYCVSSTHHPSKVISLMNGPHSFQTPSVVPDYGRNLDVPS